jgi:hypothetical protein
LLHLFFFPLSVSFHLLTLSLPQFAILSFIIRLLLLLLLLLLISLRLTMCRARTRAVSCTTDSRWCLVDNAQIPEHQVANQDLF